MCVCHISTRLPVQEPLCFGWASFVVTNAPLLKQQDDHNPLPVSRSACINECWVHSIVVSTCERFVCRDGSVAEDALISAVSLIAIGDSNERMIACRTSGNTYVAENCNVAPRMRLPATGTCSMNLVHNIWAVHPTASLCSEYECCQDGIRANTSQRSLSPHIHQSCKMQTYPLICMWMLPSLPTVWGVRKIALGMRCVNRMLHTPWKGQNPRSRSWDQMLCPCG